MVRLVPERAKLILIERQGPFEPDLELDLMLSQLAGIDAEACHPRKRGLNVER